VFGSEVKHKQTVYTLITKAHWFPIWKSYN